MTTHNFCSMATATTHNSFHMTMAIQDDSDSFQHCASKKRTPKKRRLHVGNLPADCPDLASKLADLFQSLDFPTSNDSISIQDDDTAAPCYALVECESQQQLDLFIRKLHNQQFEGKRLSVRLHEARHYGRGNKHNSFASSSSWTKPRNETRIDKAEEIPDQHDGTNATVSTNQLVNPFGNKPLAALLADYGDQDADWKNAVVVDAEAPAVETNHCDSVLGQHGKAPIHICVTSFGYRHGAPPDHGWSHAQPLKLFDVRHFEPVPHYLAWQHGLSASVKYALMRQDKEGLIKKTSKDIAEQVAAALEAAIAEAGHGYAMPLKMAVFVGSDNGQHRSVMMAEQVAMGVRRQLRENVNVRFGTSVKVSVGTMHRDMERKHKDNATKPKQKALEEDW